MTKSIMTAERLEHGINVDFKLYDLAVSESRNECDTNVKAIRLERGRNDSNIEWIKANSQH